MNVYTVYADLKEGVSPKGFRDGCAAYLDSLPMCKAWRITRMKLGFRSKDLGEWRIDMDFETMQDLDDAMSHTLLNGDTVTKHIGFNKLV